MEKQVMQGWYWIMPNNILFDNTISDKSKLLFCLISSLCAEKWFCRATNEYLAGQLWVTDRTIRERVWELQEHWYIAVLIEDGFKRTIRVKWGEENFQGDGKKLPQGDGKKLPDNNTSSNITNKNSLAKFEEFWNKRPKKEWRKATLKKFINLSQEKQNKAIDGIDKRKKTDRWQKWIIMAATTYINQERREDELVVEQQTQRVSSIMRH